MTTMNRIRRSWEPEPSGTSNDYLFQQFPWIVLAGVAIDTVKMIDIVQLIIASECDSWGLYKYLFHD